MNQNLTVLRVEDISEENGPAILNQITTNDKYTDDFLERAYSFWGDALEPFVHPDTFFQLEQEAKAETYHRDYLAGYQEFTDAKVMKKTRAN